MSSLALVSLLSAIVIIFVGNFVYYKDPKNQLNKTFLVFYVLYAYWAFTEFAYRQAGDYETARLWLKIGSFWPLAAAVLLHFVLVFTEQWQRFEPRLAGLLLYGPALVFSLVDLTTNLISGEPIRMYWGWTYGNSDSIVRELADVWALSVAIMAVVLCWRFFMQTTDPLKKQQAKFITLGFFFSVTAGVVTEIILPWLGIRVPELTSTFSLVEVSFIGYAIWKYKLFAMSAETAAEGIIATMSDALLLLSPEGRIQRVNQAALRLLGYNESELIDQPFAMLGANIGQDHNPDFSQHWFATLRQTGLVNDFETSLKTKGDQNIPVSLSGSIVRNKHSQPEGIVCVGRDLSERKRAEATLRRAHDELELRVQKRTAELATANGALQIEITERKRAEEQIKASLREKEVLLQEIHHRVKNNLQVISSLLNLQSGYLECPQASDIFKDSQHRVRSMALIHEKLYRSENLAEIDFGEYIQDLAAYLFRSQNASSRGITLTVQAEHVFLDVDAAVPCGLIVNELVSNTLKHAFPNGQTGESQIAMRADANHHVTLIVSDNGVGFPPELDFGQTESLGLQLVNTLVDQLDGTIELYHKNGTNFKITFSTRVEKAQNSLPGFKE